MTTQGVKCISWNFFNVNSTTATAAATTTTATTSTTTVHNIYKHSYGDQLMQATEHIQ
jgi:hypothetical protein